MSALVQLPHGNVEPPIRVLIVDDEPTARQRMVRLLSGIPAVTIVGVCSSGREATEAVQAHEPELVFLDIAMPGIDGLDAARRFGTPTGPVVVFVTAYDEHALEAFRVHATDYVLKPIDQTRLRDVLEHARVAVRRIRVERERAGAQTTVRFAIRDGRRTRLVPVTDLLWIESFGNYARVHTTTGRFVSRATMASISEQLAPHGFARIHCKVIVNVARVTQLRPRGSGQVEVVLDTGTRLRMSRTFRSAVEDVWRGGSASQ